MEKLLARCSIRTAVCSVLLIVLIPLGGSVRLSRPSSAADLLLLNAHVLTMDQTRPAAQAIAIQGDRIAWAGASEEAQRLFPGSARTIDLHGATVLPGIIDAHTHLIELGKSLLSLNLKDIASEKEALSG